MIISVFEVSALMNFSNNSLSISFLVSPDDVQEMDSRNSSPTICTIFYWYSHPLSRILRTSPLYAFSWRLPPRPAASVFIYSNINIGRIETSHTFKYLSHVSSWLISNYYRHHHKFGRRLHILNRQDGLNG